MDSSLHEKLLYISESDEYAFHMPGHKRNETEKPFDTIMKLDITEIKGFDNLHHPETIIKQEQEFAADLYGSKQTFFLINGSTSGILAAICSATKEDDSIVFSRNSHKSGYHALYLKGLHPVYVYPMQKAEFRDIYGPVNPEDVAKQMDETGAKVVFVTSPTYEGVVSDIEKIAECVHRRKGILIVDEAHGAHLGFNSYFPESAIKKGADIVIQSIHKTLPSLTQTALLHVCSDRININEIAMQLAIFQTSSPSYVLMASMSRCLHLLQKDGEKIFDLYACRLKSFYNRAKQLQKLFIPDIDFFKKIFETSSDPSKINICTSHVENGTGIKKYCTKNGIKYTGKDLAKDLLEDYHLQIEMISENYVIAMTSLYDTQEGFDRLEKALLEIDQQLVLESEEQKEELTTIYTTSSLKMPITTIKEAMNAPKNLEKWNNCIGKISAEFIYLYPPGSPIITPGECITKEIWNVIDRYKNLGLSIQGPKDYSLEEIYTLQSINESAIIQ